MGKAWVNKGFTLMGEDENAGKDEANSILIDPVFDAAKHGDEEAAKELWEKEWNRNAGENQIRLEQSLEKGKMPVFISVPGTTRRNQIPPTAAAILANVVQGKGRYINGDKWFFPLHLSAMKKIQKRERLFYPRVYGVRASAFPAIKKFFADAQFFVTEDLLTTGNSAHSFQRFLEKAGLEVDGIIALKGNYTPNVPPKLVKRIDRFFKENDIQVDGESFCREITEKEAQNLAFNVTELYKKANPRDKRMFNALLETLADVKINQNLQALPKLEGLQIQLSLYLMEAKKKKENQSKKGKENQNEISPETAAPVQKVSMREKIERQAGKIPNIVEEDSIRRSRQFKLERKKTARGLLAENRLRNNEIKRQRSSGDFTTVGTGPVKINPNLRGNSGGR